MHNILLVSEDHGCSPSFIYKLTISIPDEESGVLHAFLSHYDHEVYKSDFGEFLFHYQFFKAAYLRNDLPHPYI